MKKFLLIITLMIMIVPLAARPLANSGKSAEYPEFAAGHLKQNSSGNSGYGRNFYRSNSLYKFHIRPEDKFQIENNSAEIHLITWDKDYAEMSVMKVSDMCCTDLDNVEVWVDGSKLHTCCNNPDSHTLMKIVLKLPEYVNLGNISGNGNIVFQNYSPEYNYSR